METHFSLNFLWLKSSFECDEKTNNIFVKLLALGGICFFVCLFYLILNRI